MNKEEYEQFIGNTQIFVNNVNSSLIEREQLIDSLEILLEAVMDYQAPGDGMDKPFRRIESLLEVLILSWKHNQEVDEDTARMYEQGRLLPVKRKLDLVGVWDGY